MSTSDLAWVAVDWGTSHLRLWRILRDGTLLGPQTSDQGMGKLVPDAFEPVLRGLLGDLSGVALPLPVMICGMAGARQGWTEAPYVSVPAVPPGPNQAARPDTGGDLDVRILPGMMQDRPADVMRGEETQIAGLLAADPDFDGVVCLPGTHTKWARISAREVVSFQTCMTGEIFALLSTQSVLRHSVAGDGWDEAAFEDAVSEGLSHPATLSARLFGLRAETLLHGMTIDTARARLSGLLIGIELAATRPYWLGQKVAILGAQGLSRAYEAALALQGVTAVRHDADTLTLAGLTAAHDALEKDRT